MKKGQTGTGIVKCVRFPNKGIVEAELEQNISGTTEKETVSIEVVVKNTLPGQRVSFQINKLRGGKAEGRLLEIEKQAENEIESPCRHFGICGGCNYMTLPYAEQLKLKEQQVREMLEGVLLTSEQEKNEEGGNTYIFEGIKGSPRQYAYRNKMEFSFGDDVKDGPLALGMHKRGSFYDVVSVSDCQIVDEDYRKILKCVLAFFREKDVTFYHKMTHIGYLRHLLVRKAAKTGEILVDIITSSQTPPATPCLASGLMEDFTEELCKLKLDGSLVGILHTTNDALSDTVQDAGTEILYGKNYFYEELLGLRFKITPFSFFQTNSLGAEVLYATAREYVMSSLHNDSIVFDLYSGTGTIAQLLAPVVRKVIGVEIVEEAVIAARENAELNGLHNCGFIAGDVLKVLDEVEEKPDFIVLDPPRDGIHPKALEKIIHYGVENIVYISCKPTSLMRDLAVFTTRGYGVRKVGAVDMFPGTGHVEVVTCLQRVDM